jgi:hypothetical protein
MRLESLTEIWKSSNNSDEDVLYRWSAPILYLFYNADLLQGTRKQISLLSKPQDSKLRVGQGRERPSPSR